MNEELRLKGEYKIDGKLKGHIILVLTDNLGQLNIGVNDPDTPYLSIKPFTTKMFSGWLEKYYKKGLEWNFSGTKIGRLQKRFRSHPGDFEGIMWLITKVFISAKYFSDGVKVIVSCNSETGNTFRTKPKEYPPLFLEAWFVIELKDLQVFLDLTDSAFGYFCKALPVEKLNAKVR